LTRARATIAAVLLAGLCLGRAGGTAHAADAEAEGRKHARRANHLADLNRCKAALPEFDKALRLIKDPSLLFNRAECYRRTDQLEKATADYRQFLIDLPTAPNRAEVEAQIATLEKLQAPAADVAAPAETADERAREKARAAGTPPPAPNRAPLAAAPPPAPLPAPLPLDHEPPAGLLSAGAPPPSSNESEQKSGHAWLWVALGVVVVGGAVGTYLLLNQSKTDTSGGALGNYKF
jgi:tetratricopeptide (TPR) repeat protein